MAKRWNWGHQQIRGKMRKHGTESINGGIPKDVRKLVNEVTSKKKSVHKPKWNPTPEEKAAWLARKRERELRMIDDWMIRRRRYYGVQEA